MPTKEKVPDSVTHTEERHAKMKAEGDRYETKRVTTKAEQEIALAAHEQKLREDEDHLLTQHANLIKEGETRDQLLERIREMRSQVTTGPLTAPPLTPYMQQQLEIEQQAGADAVRKAEEDWERGSEARRKAREERAQREGVMSPVHHPNPSQTEQFPAEKATLGKTKK